MWWLVRRVGVAKQHFTYLSDLGTDWLRLFQEHLRAARSKNRKCLRGEGHRHQSRVLESWFTGVGNPDVELDNTVSFYKDYTEYSMNTCLHPLTKH